MWSPTVCGTPGPRGAQRGLEGGVSVRHLTKCSTRRRRPAARTPEATPEPGSPHPASGANAASPGRRCRAAAGGRSPTTAPAATAHQLATAGGSTRSRTALGLVHPTETRNTVPGSTPRPRSPETRRGARGASGAVEGVERPLLRARRLREVLARPERTPPGHERRPPSCRRGGARAGRPSAAGAGGADRQPGGSSRCSSADRSCTERRTLAPSGGQLRAGGSPSSVKSKTDESNRV